jgi:hypothetical protein
VLGANKTGFLRLKVKDEGVGRRLNALKEKSQRMFREKMVG